MPPRRQRAAAQAAAQSMKTAPQPVPDASDEEMPDAPSAEQQQTPRETAEDEAPADETQPQEEAEGDGEAKEDGQREHEEPQPAADATEGSRPAAEETEQASQQESPRPAGRVSSLAPSLAPPRRRRIGRPPKNKPPDWDAPVEGEGSSRIEVTTPVKRRGRGRPSAGGRWSRAKGGPSHVTQVPIDKAGNLMQVIDDEVDLPGDPEGETKVNKMGNLQGDREYRVRTFTILNRGDRLYMLSTEPARCIGFRDSYLFFQKHKLLYKIIIDDDAKRDLIERDLIPHSYKGRAIGVVTARSVFREFGAKIIVGGRKVVDDYNAQTARERGDVEGEIAVPDDKIPGPGEEYDRNRYVAWHGASAVYHSGAPSVPLELGKPVDSKKRKVTVTGDNWMLEHARESSRFNSSLSSVRWDVLEGTYDVHTNAIQYPKIMQPTQVRWEPITPPESDEASRRRLLDSASSVLNRPNDDGGVSDNTAAPEDDKEQPRLNGQTEHTTATTEQAGDDSSATTTTMFPPVPARFSHNFSIHDVYFESPAETALGNPGPDGDVHDVGPNGLISMSTQHGTPEFHMSREVLDELPPECRAAYVDAAAREWEWKSRWRGEKADGHRAVLPLNYSWNP